MGTRILSILTLCLLSSGLLCREDECQEGDVQDENCEHCVCEAGVWRCETTCVHLRRPRGVLVAADLKNTPCAPGDYFKIDCNTCYCNIEKTGYLCTENLCVFVEPVTNASSVANLTDVTTILQSQNFSDFSALVRNATERTQNVTIKLAVFSCTPGQTFKKACNTCTCTQDGINAICTAKNCTLEVHQVIA